MKNINQIRNDYQRTSNYDFHDSSTEYKIVEDEVKKITSISVFKFEINIYDDQIGIGHNNSKFQDWLETDEAIWLMSHRIGDPKFMRFVNHETYADMIKVIVKLYEEHAVYHALKWR